MTRLTILPCTMLWEQEAAGSNPVTPVCKGALRKRL